MPYTTPPTFNPGDPLAAADLNILGDDIEYLKGITDGVSLSAVKVRRSANQSIGNSTDVEISFDTEVLDLGGWWTSGTDIIVPAGAIPAGFTTVGVIILLAIKFATNGTGKRQARVLLNGSSVDFWLVPALDDGNTSIFISTFTTVEAGDVITLEAWQSSGGSLNVTEAHVSVLRFGVAG